MGTRRSRHNKGRRPLYKFFDRETIRKLDQEPKPKPPKIVPLHHNDYRAPRTREVIALEKSVAAFLDQRRQRDAEEKARIEKKRHAPWPENETVFRSEPTGELIGVSDRDILLQLFVEKKISGHELGAGRRWQILMQRATLQPMTAIDWSEPIIRMRYQTKGSVSESQWDAMRDRRIFREETGPANLTLLDYCLSDERTRSEILRTLRIDEGMLVPVFHDLLSKLLTCFGSGVGSRRAA